ncbi:MAG: hypothetical protein WCL18_05775 [bacterium]
MYIPKKIQESGFSSVEEFVAYCEKKSLTREALFSKDELLFMLQLAGNPNNWPTPKHIQREATKMYRLREEMSDLIVRYRLIEERIKKVSSCKELREVALMILTTTCQPVSTVCGPITTGGTESVAENVHAMQTYIAELQEAGENVFDETRFIEAIERVKASDEESLDDFYLALYTSGCIEKTYFMKDYQSSTGSKLRFRLVYIRQDEMIYQ